MVTPSKLKSGQHFFHSGIGELVFDRDATAELVGCTKDNLTRLSQKGKLKPLKARYNRMTVYAQSDIEEYLSQR